jgi:hypothetical protein
MRRGSTVAPGTSWTPTERRTPLAPAGAEGSWLPANTRPAADRRRHFAAWHGRPWVPRGAVVSKRSSSLREHLRASRPRPPLYGAAFARSIQTVTGEVRVAWSVTGPAMVVWPGWSLLIRRSSHRAYQRHPGPLDAEFVGRRLGGRGTFGRVAHPVSRATAASRIAVPDDPSAKMAYRRATPAHSQVS